MSALGAFLDFAIPLAKEVLVPIVRAFFQSRPDIPVPPSVQPYLDAKARHAAIAAARLEAERKGKP